MPFTLAHAAAALPLRRLLRGAADFPALVIGCFIPDIPYFLPRPLCDINAHLLPGLILFGIPCGWAIYALWFGLLREPMAVLLPRRCAALLIAAGGRSTCAARAGAGTLSLLAGALSHVAWDAFTHRRGLIVHAWPTLAQPLLPLGDQTLPPYFLLQHGSTLVGMLCLALHVRRRLRQIAPTHADAEPALQLSARHKLAVASLLSIASAYWVWRTFSSEHALQLSAYNVVCCSISSGATLFVAYALVWHGYRLLGRRRERR